MVALRILATLRAQLETPATRPLEHLATLGTCTSPACTLVHTTCPEASEVPVLVQLLKALLASLWVLVVTVLRNVVAQLVTLHLLVAAVVAMQQAASTVLALAAAVSEVAK